MKKDVADFTARMILKSQREITFLIPFLKDHLESEEEYEHFRKALLKIARVAADDIVLRIFEEHPDVQSAIEKSIKDFGQIP